MTPAVIACLLLCLLLAKDTSCKPLKDVALGGNELDSILLHDGAMINSTEIFAGMMNLPHVLRTNATNQLDSLRNKRSTVSVGIDFTNFGTVLSSFLNSLLNIVTFRWN